MAPWKADNFRKIRSKSTTVNEPIDKKSFFMPHRSHDVLASTKPEDRKKEERRVSGCLHH